MEGELRCREEDGHYSCGPREIRGASPDVGEACAGEGGISGFLDSILFPADGGRDRGAAKTGDA